jgi:AraC-like DNA-binding protein
MTTPSRQARLYTQRRNTQRLPRPDRSVDGFARFGALTGEDTTLATPGALPLRRLANGLAAYAPHDGAFQLRLPGTYAVRLSRLTTEASYATLGPALCVAAQGAKVVMLGREVLEYDPAQMLVLAVGLPISSQVTRASRKDPYLGFILDLDPARVRELAARVYPRGVPKASDDRGLYVGRATDDIVDAVIWIRAHFAQPVTVEEMAASVHMSASSFHQRFKAVTTMSPLQYQKVLRLHEARRLMLFQNMDASDACHRVGYLSASQFSREYIRFFGNAPSKDIARLREEGLGRSDGDR